MHKINFFLRILFLLIFLILLIPRQSFAVYDPVSRVNNFFGIHILFTSELSQASKLVNTSNGDWGYVTIPLQAGDKDLKKWQGFMDDAKKMHLIPLIRLSTEEDFISKGTWRKPDDNDIVDFANFLNSLSWPTKNRYVVLFNEVNRYDEWGGETPDPVYYSDIVSFAYETFKARSNEFYIILGGFDNASITDGNGKYMNEFDYLSRMVMYNQNIFDKIDGISSHSYPNPGFSQYPSKVKRMGVATYKYEYDFINYYAASKKPVFITETGWDSTVIPEQTIASYYKYTYDNIWTLDQDKIVAITPFLLMSENGGFDKFSFYKNGKPTKYCNVISEIKKSKGDPEINSAETNFKIPDVPLTKVKKFKDYNSKPVVIKIPTALQLYLKMIFGF